MVAIIRCTTAETQHVEFKEKLHPPARREEWDWSITRPKEFWTKGSHLTLIATPDVYRTLLVTRLGMTRREKAASDLDEKLRILHTLLIDRPVPLDDLLGMLHSRYQRHLVAEGQQPEGTGKALIEALIRLRPEVQSTIDHIDAATSGYRVHSESKAGHALAVQRDATLAIPRMAGMVIPQLARWDPPAERLYDDVPPPRYLALLGGPSGQLPRSEIALEDHLITHDTENLVGWLGGPTGHVSWRQFSYHGQRLFVANANRTIAEHISGADIIYYNDTRKNLILVQYKKLNAHRNGFYYPDSDSSLNKELQRLRAVDRYAAFFREPHDEHRLCADPSWIKLCPPEAIIPQADAMVPGMYFSRQHFEQLRQDARLRDGSKGGVRFGFSNVPSYLDNTMFSRLVETGMIGTTGVSTDLVHRQITRSLDEGRMLILGYLTGDEAPQSVRNSRRRQSQ